MQTGRIAKTIKLLVFCLLVIAVVMYMRITPSSDRVWSADQRILLEIDIAEHIVHIRNIRNLSYTSADDYTLSYYDRSFDVRDLRGVWYMVERLSDTLQGVAHTLLSFEFENGQFVVISVEVRKEVGEQYSLLKGVLKQFELTYVIADERDVLQLRTTYRGNDVFLFPIDAPREQLQALFLDMLQRAKQLQEQPEFYNTLTNTCTTNIVDHVRAIVPGSVPLSLKVVLPGYSDSLAYDVGLLGKDRSLEELRSIYYISRRARDAASTDDFSTRIREGLPRPDSWSISVPSDPLDP